MPVDPKTGKEYPYTDEGIAQYQQDTGKGMPMKNSGFKMRSGNTTPFKQMGSTPAKGIVSKLVGAGVKKAIGGAGLNVGPGMPLAESPTRQIDPLDLGLLDEAKSFDKKHKAFKDFDKWHKTLGQTPSNISDKKGSMPKSFNIKGSSVEGPITADKYKQPTVKTKPSSTISKIKNITEKGGKLLKNVGKRFLGPVGIGLTAYDIATTIPKVTKATQEGLKTRAKEETETGFTNPGIRKI